MESKDSGAKALVGRGLPNYPKLKKQLDILQKQITRAEKKLAKGHTSPECVQQLKDRLSEVERILSTKEETIIVYNTALASIKRKKLTNGR